MTGAIGAAAGHGRWGLAIAAAALTFAALRWLTPIARHMEPQPDAGDRGGPRTAAMQARPSEDDRPA